VSYQPTLVSVVYIINCVLSAHSCLCCLQHKLCPISPLLSLLSTASTVSYQPTLVSVVYSINCVISAHSCLCCLQHKRCPINRLLSLLSTAQTVCYQPTDVASSTLNFVLLSVTLVITMYKMAEIKLFFFCTGWFEGHTS